MDEDKHEEVEESAFDEEPNKGKDTPYTNNNIFSLEKRSIFWRTFTELENAERVLNPDMDVANITISGERLQDALASSGKFTQSDGAIIIKDMAKDGRTEEVQMML